MPKQFYYITNFINECLEGYYDNGHPKLTCFKDDAIQLNLNVAESELKKLHKMGYTGLEISTIEDIEKYLT